jgi:hypothetical protein
MLQRELVVVVVVVVTITYCIPFKETLFFLNRPLLACGVEGFYL